MSKGVFELGRSAIRTFKFAYSQFRHLPLVIVGAVTWGAAGFVLAANVEAKVPDIVVISAPAAVVDQLMTLKSATEVFRHDPTVLENVATFTTHQIKHSEIVIGDSVLAECDVARFVKCATRGVAGAAKGFFLGNGRPTWFAYASEVWFVDHVSNGAHGIPTTLRAHWTNDPYAGSSVTVNRHGGDVVSVHRMVFRQRTGISWHGHRSSFVSLFNGYIL